MEIKKLDREKVNNFFMRDPHLVLLGLNNEDIVKLHETKNIYNDDALWLGVYKNDILIAIGRFEPLSNICWNYHLYITTGFRKRGSSKDIHELLEDYIREYSNITTLVVLAPEPCVQTHRAVEKVNFILSGTIPNGIKWREEMVDLRVYHKDLWEIS